jgi:leucyl-tRNA synthetase
MEYNPSQIESKWQKYWEENNSFEPEDNFDKEKKYILSMFPYPSGRIHMGHVRNYCIGDAIARNYRQQGFNVLHPIGWDAFGMPAENAAIKHKLHPKKWTYENIAYMQKELQSLGLSFSKTREFATCDEIYTKFEQEFFIDMFNAGMLYQKESKLNWCEDCHTVLANEQVEDGCCWRCDNKVEQKEMMGYYLKITDYAQELLDDLEKLQQGWPNQVLTMQNNWIGRSEGLEFTFKLDDDSIKKLDNKFDSYTVFTTRPDTIMGVSYSALAPEHDIVKYLIDNKLISDEKIAEISKMQNATNVEREANEKSGVDLEINVIHPITKKLVPVWVANFVLVEYGGGAVMAVPAHDQRDYEFATKYNLPINQVIEGGDISKEAYTEAGTLINSGKYDGQKNNKAKKSIIYDFEQEGIGKKVINFKLRDWGISRQRYWGAPIPTIKCSDCGIVTESKENLPIALPEDVQITGEGNPLDTHPTWKNCKCPKCGKNAIRETDTMDTFVQSSWYFLRYTTPKELMDKVAFDKDSVNYWMNVDQYIGGIEHAILHLLYARYFTKILRDLKYIDSDEPFENLLTQGMVLKEGSKMSKSKGNTVDPGLIIEKYGSDTARLFILFAAPPARELDWNDDAVEGSFRFIKRFFDRSANAVKSDCIPTIDHSSLSKEEKLARKKVYETVLKQEQTYGKDFGFNTLIASCMEALNSLNGIENQDIWTEAYWVLSNILEPIIPHTCWEISSNLFEQKNFGKIEVIKETLIDDSITLGITVNGKRRAEIEVAKDTDKDTILEESKKIAAKWLEDKQIVKEIYVPNKLVNLVVK